MSSKAVSLGKLAEMTGATLANQESSSLEILGVADIESASPSDITFLSNARYASSIKDTLAGAIFIDPDAYSALEQKGDTCFLLHKDPSKAFQIAVEWFLSESMHMSFFQKIHASSYVDPEAQIGKDVTIGPRVVIEKGAVIGDRTIISTGCYIGPYTTLGNDCLIHPNVVIREACHIGNRVILQPGAIIGSCGFGYLTDKQGKHTKLNQLGSVVIEDDVEIGANTTVDRARFQTTRIGMGTKIDNLVLVAHGVTIGKHCIIVGQTGIAGSTKIGNHVIIAGQCAIAGHLKICDGVMLAGRTGVTKSITKPGKYGGIPAQPLEDFHKNTIHAKNMDKYVQELKQIKERFKQSE